VVIDCPETTFIPQLTTTGAFRRILDEHNATPHFLFHRLGDGVLDDARYIAWMRSFGDEVYVSVAPDHFSFTLSLALSAYCRKSPFQLG
jgi:ribonuclease Z